MFRLQPNGFTNRDLRALTAELRGLDPTAVTAGQITYDLRRLQTHGLIARIPHTHRYPSPTHGLHTAMFLTCVHDRSYAPASPNSPPPHPPRAGSDARPPPTAERSTPSPPQHNSRHERSRTNRMTPSHLTQKSGFPGYLAC